MKLISYVIILVLLSSFCYAALTDNNTVYLTMDDADYVNLEYVDQVNGNNNGTLINSTGSYQGIIGQSVSMQNTGYIIVNHSTDLNSNSNNFSLSFWVNTSTLSVVEGLVSKGNANDYWRVIFLSDNTIQFLLKDNPNQCTYHTTNAKRETGWHFIAVSYENGACDTDHVKIYYDGASESISQQTSGVPSSVDNSNNLEIGDDRNSNYFTGNIDEFSFWQRVISRTEVSTLNNSGIGIQYPYNVTPIPGLSVQSNLQNNIEVIDYVEEVVTYNGSFTGGYTKTIANCSFLVDGTLNQTDYNVNLSVLQDFTYSYGFKYGNVSFQINCSNDEVSAQTSIFSYSVDTTRIILYSQNLNILSILDGTMLSIYYLAIVIIYIAFLYIGYKMISTGNIISGAMFVYTTVAIDLYFFVVLYDTFYDPVTGLIVTYSGFQRWALIIATIFGMFYMVFKVLIPYLLFIPSNYPKK